MLVSPSIKALAALFLYKYIHFEVLCATHELVKTRTTNQRPDCTLPSSQKPNRLLETLIRYPDFGTKTVALSLDVHNSTWLLHFPLGKLLEELPALRELSLSPPPMYWTPLEDLQNLTSVQLDFHRAVYDDCSQGDGLFMADGVPLHIVARYLSLPSLRRLQAKKIYFAPGCVHQQYPNKTQEQYGGSSIDDLRFLGCDAYGPDGDSLVAGFISSVKQLKRFVFEMNGIGEVSLAEQFKAIGRALMAHHTTLDKIVLAESDTILFTTWAIGNLKDCSSIKRLAIPIHTTFGNFDTGSGFETFHALHKYIPPQLEELQIQLPVGVSELDGWHPVMQDAAAEAKVSYGEGLLRMWELIENKDAHVPGLKRVIWWFQQSSQDPLHKSGVPAFGSVSHMDELGQAFGKVGVEFELVLTPFFKDTPFGKRLYEW